MAPYPYLLSRALRASLSLVVAGFVVACSDPAPAPAPLPRFVTDAQGRALVLHGINVANSSKGAEDRHPAITEDDVDRIALDWGMNFVRYLIFWDAVEPAQGSYDTAYLDEVAERLDWFAERGVHVVLDMHQDVYSAAFCCDGAPPWAIRDDGAAFSEQPEWYLNYLQPAVRASFDNFFEYDGDHPDLQDSYAAAWRAVAERFRDHPAVLGYDLMNEPHAGSRFDALEALGLGTSEDSPSPAFDRELLGPFYQRVIDAVREVDADAWIFFEPRYGAPGNGSPSFLPVLVDPRPGEDRLVYAPHLYSVWLEAGGSYGESDSVVADWEASRTAELELQRAPLVLGEWGLNLDAERAEAFVLDVLDLADRMTAGWAYWSYDPSSWGPMLGDGTDAWSVDYLVRPYPRAVAGAPVAFAFDVGTRVFTLTVERRAGASGPTEIHVPRARLYPEGFDVEVDDAPGTFSSEWDEARQILSLELDPARSSHAIVIRPTSP